MKFKEFYYKTEGRDINEGPRGRKVGEFLGGMAGLAAPALAGSAISGDALGGSMFDQHGAPGGLLGTGVGVLKGRHAGSALGGAIGDKIGDGMGWLGKKIFGAKKKKGDPNAYFNKLTGGRDMGDPDAIEISPDKNQIRKNDHGDNGEDYLRNRSEMEEASKTLSAILNDKILNFGYSPHEIQQMITNLGDSNRVLRSWKLHKYDQMVGDEIKAGRPGTARMIGKRGIEELQKAGVLPPPSNDLPVHSEPTEDEPTHDLAHEPNLDMDQPSMHRKKVDLFGEEIPEEKPKKKPSDKIRPKRTSRAKKKVDAPGLFDNF